MERKDLLRFLSKTGYKRDSQDINNPFNIIPSGDITMEGVDFPVIGVDNLGDEKIMFPGENYQFKGDFVIERPLDKMQGGGETDEFDFSKKADRDRYKKLYGEGKVFNKGEDDTYVGKAFPEVSVTEMTYPSDGIGAIGEAIFDVADTPANIIAELIAAQEGKADWSRILPEGIQRNFWDSEPKKGRTGSDTRYGFGLVDKNGIKHVPSISEADGFFNTASAIGQNVWNGILDLGSDPSSYVGVGLAKSATKSADDIMKTAIRQGVATTSEISEYVAKKLSKEMDNTGKTLSGKELSSLTNNLTSKFQQLKKSGNYKLPKTININDIEKPFKSEIDWGKWNKEIPYNKPLMEEYAKIEKTFKADGTWMKNPNGGEFNGTPEQFVLINSKNFKKAFPEGYEAVFRGGIDNGILVPSKSMFTSNKSLALDYIPNQLNEDRRLLELAHRKSKNKIIYEGNRDVWADLGLQTIDQQISHSKRELTKLKKEFKNEILAFNGSPFLKEELLKLQDVKIKKIEDRIDLLKKSNSDSDDLLNKMRRELSYDEKKKIDRNIQTNDIAKYVEDNNLDYVKLNNIDDAGIGDVTIVNHKPGNYLKSLIGNNGMFDMTNPNIYKGLVGLGIPSATLLKSKENNYGLPKKYKKGGTVYDTVESIENIKELFTLEF